MRVLLVATYELGHQPGNLAGPAALLSERGHEVRVIDTSLDAWDPELAAWADKVAFSVPMHTATRLVRELAADLTTPVCCYGLYAAMCADVAERVIAGEYEDALVDWVERASHGISVQLERPVGGRSAPRPRRDALAPLERYVQLVDGSTTRLVGSVEASRGCAHRCRHCPVPVVYDGRVRVTDEAFVLEDIAQLADLGATHITFADPDFLNAPQHSMRVARGMHAQWPELTFDCTVKVEHVLRHAALFPELASLGCLFVVSAFESVDDAVLERLDKGHTTADAARAVGLLRATGVDVRPSFLPFTPWTSPPDLVSLLDFVADHDLAGSVDPVQYAIRLLLPRGSLLLDLPEMRPFVGEWDDQRLTYEWCSADPAADELQVSLTQLLETSIAAGDDALTTYAKVRDACGAPPVDLTRATRDRPHLTESWFCCAEPTATQISKLRDPVPVALSRPGGR